jgi:DNA replication protein DnaC
MLIKAGDLMGAEGEYTESEHQRNLRHVQCANDSIGHLDISDGIDCKKCHNKGFVYFLEGEGAYEEVHCSECTCMEQRRLVRRAKASGMGKYLDMRLSDFKDDTPFQKKIKSVAEEYIQEESDTNTWIFMGGQQGCGKSMLCSIISNSLLFIDGRNVLYLPWGEFINGCKSAFAEGSSIAREMDKAQNADVLFIDDLLKAETGNDMKYASVLLNYRYSSKKKTIITTELDIKSLLGRDEGTFGRVAEMCGKYIICIAPDKKKDYRLSHFEGVTL